MEDTYSFDPSRRAILEAKNEVFQQLVTDFPTSLGKETSKAERDSEGNRDPVFTYGEVGERQTDFISFGEAFDVIQHKYGALPPGGVFYDLGSVIGTQGSGKGVLAAALLHPFAQCKGIELIHGLYFLSLRLKDCYDERIAEIVSQHGEWFPVVPTLTFEDGSFLDHSWEDASLIFANSTCFSLALLAQIADKPVSPGCFAITLTKNLPGHKWEVLDSFRRPMSWGEATIFLHRRVA